jgi:predicted phosphodiesterase
MPRKLVAAVAMSVLVVVAGFLTAYSLGIILRPEPTVTVDGGVVLSRSDGEVRIWCCRPNITVDLSDFEGKVILTNCMAGSTMEGSPDTKQADDTSVSFSCDGSPLSVSIVPPSKTEFTYAVMGDSQGRNDILGAILPHLEGCEFALLCGDLTPSGTDDQFAAVQEVLLASPVPVYTTAGNHDVMYEEASNYQERFGPTQYSFDFGGIRFAVVDSSDLNITGEQVSWMRDVFVGAEKKAVVTHAPFVDPFGDNHTLFPDSCARMIEFVQSDCVDVVFTGHIHAFNHTIIAGTDLIITGGAGGSLVTGDHHFVNVTVSSTSETDYTRVNVTVDMSSLPHVTLVSRTGEALNMSHEELFTLSQVHGFSSYENFYGNVGGAGDYTGVLVRALIDLIGGMSEGETLRATSFDGYVQEFGYLNVYPDEEWSELQGEMMIALTLESVSIPDWEDGPKLIMLAPDGLYSNADCEATSYDGQGYSLYPSAGARWVKSVHTMEVVVAG